MLLKLKLNPPAPKEQEAYNRQEEQVIAELERILLQIENHLKEKARKFICTADDISFVDIQYYNEIYQAQALNAKLATKVSREAFPKLTEWKERV